jgi:hypothetical protein
MFSMDRIHDTRKTFSTGSSSGVPAGFEGDFTITGGVAPIKTALATRFVPWRPM